MLVLGLDPGSTTGWCLYDTEAKRVVDCGSFREHAVTQECQAAYQQAAHTVIERPKAYGPTRPQVVDCAWTAGRLCEGFSAIEFTRREVKEVLTTATRKDVSVRDDATAWAALVLLHGDGCDVKPSKKNGLGGSIGRVTSHERAALALVVAWAIQQGHWKP